MKIATILIYMAILMGIGVILGVAAVNLISSCQGDNVVEIINSLK